MRVLHVQKVKGVGGSERHLLTLLPALSARGVDVRLCVLEAGDAPRFLAAAREKGIATRVMRAGPDLNPVLVGALLREIRASRPDVVHTHLIHADLHGQVAARLAGVPAVSSVHSVHAFYRRGPGRLAAMASGRLAARTIAISQHVARHLAAHDLAPAARIRVIPYGIDADAWPVGDEERERARAGFGIGPGDLVVGVASRLVAGKGHAELIEAFSAILPEEPGARLLVAGAGPLRGELERRSRDLGVEGAVRFLGHVGDVRAFMAACDALAFPTLPSLGEGFGLAALEAMSSARPVVASRMGPLPEIVEDGETGFLVAPGSAEELAAALRKLLADAGLRERMGAAGRDRGRSMFGVEPMVERTIGVYREAVAAR